MTRFALTTVVAAFALIVSITPSSGQPVCATPGCNPTVSDANGNTAGGRNALVNVFVLGPFQGFRNTAFGFRALQLNTFGSENTASGDSALNSNTTGSSNTATGVAALNDNDGNHNTATGFAALQLH